VRGAAAGSRRPCDHARRPVHVSLPRPRADGRPANAFLALTCLAAVLLELARDPRAVWEAFICDRRSWLAYALVGAVILLTLATVKISEAWFWLADVNRDSVGDPLAVMAQSFGHHFWQVFRRIDPIGSRHPHLFAALALFAVAMWRFPPGNGRPAKLLLVFILVICATATLTQWRTDDGFKSLTIFGLTVGSLYLAFHLCLRELRADSDVCPAPLLAICVRQAGALGRIVAFDTVPGPRHAALDSAKVCRFTETENCRCMQVTAYGPQVYLWNDMRACRSRLAAISFSSDQVPALRRMLLDDVRRPDTAFWKYAPEHTRMGGLPGAAIDYWEKQAVCFPLDRMMAICIAGS